MWLVSMLWDSVWVFKKTTAHKLIRIINIVFRSCCYKKILLLFIVTIDPPTSSLLVSISSRSAWVSKQALCYLVSYIASAQSTLTIFTVSICAHARECAWCTWTTYRDVRTHDIVYTMIASSPGPLKKGLGTRLIQWVVTSKTSPRVYIA